MAEIVYTRYNPAVFALLGHEYKRNATFIFNDNMKAYKAIFMSNFLQVIGLQVLFKTKEERLAFLLKCPASQLYDKSQLVCVFKP